MAVKAAPSPVEDGAFRRQIRVAIESELGDRLDGAILFGSRARGDATDDSDWDVLVAVREDADRDAARTAARRVASRLLMETTEGVRFLVIKWSEANDHAPVLLNVLEDGVRL